ncbi:riboflavin synthase domain-like protein [Gonapodya prolifera JEL478]|uniref:Methionine synthase reductase n=1 Tax=Gonapodya prolifera (strain JEL478) TaxID=1344416 RepID=A0A139ANH3_GONPJ|nr:riboflavin synthase domain-like protein [Gonapodya prolifera JEL478]|eukprot:KXS18268.1 riboflavin synthase domain-like protein [Gonapodya prolifera JEL478]
MDQSSAAPQADANGASLAKSLVILYASQTGNAEFIARHINTEAVERGYSSNVFVCDDYGKVDFSLPSIVVIVASTTGDGDPPDNSTKFWRFIRREKPDKTPLAGKRYAVLGLGDTNYSQFANASKRFDKQLQNLGAVCFHRGFADDATGLEAVVDPWIAKLWDLLPDLLELSDKVRAAKFKAASKSAISSLRGTVNGKSTAADETTKQPPAAEVPSTTATKPVITTSDSVSTVKVTSETLWSPAPLELDLSVLSSLHTLSNVTKLPVTSLKISATGVRHPPRSLWDLCGVPSGAPPVSDPFSFSPARPYPAVVTARRTLTKTSAISRVIELTLSIATLGWKYRPGDAVGALAPNPTPLVDGLLAKLGLDGDGEISVEGEAAAGLSVGSLLPPLMTWRELFTWGPDLLAAPKKGLLRVLAESCSDPGEKREALFLCSKEGASSYRALPALQPTLLDLLCRFPSAQPEPFRLLGQLPHLVPRFYSVASFHPNGTEVKIAFGVVEYELRGSKRKGLATGFLEEATNGQGAESAIVIPVFPRPSNSFVAPDPSVPVLMVSAGTGITPFISFVEERTLVPEKSRGTGWLVYGCRWREVDDLYADTRQRSLAGGVLTRTDVVYSRETQEGSGSIVKYVQHLLRREGMDVWKFVVGGGTVCICGDLHTMAKEVHAALVDIALQYATEGELKGGMDGQPELIDASPNASRNGSIAGQQVAGSEGEAGSGPVGDIKVGGTSPEAKKALVEQFWKDLTVKGRYLKDIWL